MKDNLNPKNIKRRMKAETPPFWKTVRNIAIAVGAVSATVLTAPITLPAAIITAAGYGALVSGIVATVAQTTTNKRIEDK